MAAAGFAQMGFAGLGMIEAKSQADAQKREAERDAKQMEFNANLLEFKKKDLKKIEKSDIQRREDQVNQMLGGQKLSLAAQGIDVDSEVAGVIEDEERRIGREDVQAIKNNAWREAQGLELEQFNLRSNARSTRLTGVSRANSTITTGGLNSANQALAGYGQVRGSRSTAKVSKSSGSK